MFHEDEVAESLSQQQRGQFDDDVQLAASTFETADRAAYLTQTT